MTAILLSFIVIGIYAYLYGRTGIRILYKGKEKVLQSMDISIVCGITIINLYAQFFSIFYKIGALAFGILSLGAVACAVYLTGKDKVQRHGSMEILCNNISVSKVRTGLLLVSVVSVLLWTNVVPQHYDTYLYHAQAIHWIEEYGVVPGLGNLHFRLAYNSAFMPLQALFSFTWLIDSSMHTVNGFVVALLLCYVSLTFHRKKEYALQISDMLKLGMVAYLIYVSFHISSPNTDIWALLLLFYLCIKWSEFAEEKIESMAPYAFLCLLCVYAVTIKLSTAVFVLLAAYPAFLLIQKKEWKQIMMHIMAGIVIVMPYFIRNVIISGYLVYPYPEIDIFQFDWKMSENVLLEDRREIVAWARGNMDISRYQDSFLQWFPEWFRGIHFFWRILFIISIAFGILLLVKVIRDIFSHKRAKESVLIAVCMIGLLFWLLSAPLPRYGITYMLFLPCIALGTLFQSVWEGRDDRIKVWVRLCSRLGSIFLAAGILFFGIFYFPYSYLNRWGEQTILWQNDYADRDTVTVEIDGCAVSVAAQGDLTGYEPFPSTPYMGAAESIELRGEGLKSGFRVIGTN